MPESIAVNGGRDTFAHVQDIRRQLLEARDARARLVESVAIESGRRTLVFLSLNIPGPEKDVPRFDRVFQRTRGRVVGALQARLLGEGRDALGPYALAATPVSAEDTKRDCVRLEETLPSGRLVDLDVVGQDRRQVDRKSLGLPPRRCIMCDQPAVDCIRAGRHADAELRAAADRLALADVERLAKALAGGARRELDLTPKPGLVDRRDNGSHPDLSYDLMALSIALLPTYYEELVALWEGPVDIDAGIRAGLRAEERMAAAARSNTHRGYIFLSGLVLLAAAEDDCGSLQSLRGHVSELARRVLSSGSPRGTSAPTNGGDARRNHGVGGVHREALAGMPAVFEHGLPALRHGLGKFRSLQAAEHFLMAILMTKVEDTTAVHRCGMEGLQRLKRDGAELAALIDSGADYLPRIAALNDDYRKLGLTMGGVADCVALTLALDETYPGWRKDIAR